MNKNIIKIFFISLFFINFLEANEVAIKLSNDKEKNVIYNKGSIKIENSDKKILFISFLGKDCPYCFREIPHINKIYEEYKEEIEILAIETQGLNDKELKIFEKERGIKYNLTNKENFSKSDFFNFIEEETNWNKMLPFSIFIKDNNISFFKYGYKDYKKLKYYIERVKIKD